jgi:hypothetical protein
MKRILFIVFNLSLFLSVLSQTLPFESDAYLPAFYSLMKDSVDFRYYKSFNVSSQGAKYSSINQVLKYAAENKLDTISILIYGNLPAETIYFDSKFRFVSICGVNNACNTDLHNTVFVNRAESIYISLQNLSFSSFCNEGHIAYLAFFHNMVEELYSKKEVVFSDIFASEITQNFNWPSSGYLAFTQGKGVGKNFYGVISNVYNTEGDSMIIYGQNNIRELVVTNNFTFSRYLHVTGYLNVQNQISIMNGKSVSVIRANETALFGSFKSRTMSDSIYFNSESKESGVTTLWAVGGDLTVKKDGFAKIGSDGTFFIKEKNGDSLIFKGGQLLLSKNDIMGEGNIYMSNYMNLPGNPLILKYNMGVNTPIRWGIADGDKISDFSLFEDSSNCMFVRKNMKPDTLSKYGEINVYAGAHMWTAKSVKPKIINVFEQIAFSESNLLRNDSLFTWDKKNGRIIIKKEGLYFIGYNASVSFGSEGANLNKVAVRVMKNNNEQSELNGVIVKPLEKGSFQTLALQSPLRLNAGDTLYAEFYASDKGISLMSDEIFSKKSGFVFYIMEIK